MALHHDLRAHSCLLMVLIVDCDESERLSRRCDHPYLGRVTYYGRSHGGRVLFNMMLSEPLVILRSCQPRLAFYIASVSAAVSPISMRLNSRTTVVASSTVAGELLQEGDDVEVHCDVGEWF
ncbi:hypothetical protein Tco_0167247 [Tanacetum coccineum]